MLIGGAGHDTYLFNLGDGFDLIDDVGSPGEENVVVFGAGIDPGTLSFEYAGHGGGLTLKVGNCDDALYRANFNSFDATAPRPIESFQFADGTVLTFDQLFTWGVRVLGTSWVPFGGVEHLSGTFADDEIFGFGRRDELLGLDGNDTLIGGPGDDVLNGGSAAIPISFGSGTALIVSRMDLSLSLLLRRTLKGSWSITIGFCLEQGLLWRISRSFMARMASRSGSFWSGRMETHLSCRIILI